MLALSIILFTATTIAGNAAERTNLLVFTSKDGASSRVKSVNDWEVRRRAILEGFQQLAGHLPDKSKRIPLDVKIKEETDAGEYVLRQIEYSAEPNGRMPAYLLVPKGPGKFPAILSLHSTQPNTYRATAGVKPYPGNEHGVELARRGYVVLAPPYPLLGDYNPDLKALGYVSGTTKAIWDNIRALDVLESLPFVRTNGFGAIGHSLGGS